MVYGEKNHTDGPDKLVIGGELNIEAGGKLTFGDSPLAPAATQAASTASDVPGLVTDFNALLTKLKAAGIMSST